MHDDDQPSNSVAQDNWVEIAQSIRLELVARSRRLKELSMADLQFFIGCVRDGLVAEVNGSSFDKKMERATAPFGGE